MGAIAGGDDMGGAARVPGAIGGPGNGPDSGTTSHRAAAAASTASAPRSRAVNAARVAACWRSAPPPISRRAQSYHSAYARRRGETSSARPIPWPPTLRRAAMRAACRSAPPSWAVIAACAAPRQTRLSVLISRLAQTYHSANCSSELGAGLSTTPKVRASCALGAGRMHSASTGALPAAGTLRPLARRSPGAAEPGFRPRAASRWSTRAADRSTMREQCGRRH